MISIHGDRYDRLVSADAEGNWLTFRFTETNRSRKPIQEPQRYDPALELYVFAGLFGFAKRQVFVCTPPHSTFWGHVGTYGEFGHPGTLTINPGMSLEYFLRYSMPESMSDIIRHDRASGIQVWALDFALTGGKKRQLSALFTPDVVVAK